jgi:Protein of unknown function (DUF1488)
MSPFRLPAPGLALLRQVTVQATLSGIAPNRSHWRGNMPLRQGRGVHPTPEGLVFMMRDTKTGEVVPCTISAAALRRLAGRSGVPLEDAFDENRVTIEAIASRKYDAGQARPVLDEADF